MDGKHRQGLFWEPEKSLPYRKEVFWGQKCPGSISMAFFGRPKLPGSIGSPILRS